MRTAAIKLTDLASWCVLRAYEVRYALRLIKRGREGYSTLAMRVRAEMQRRGMR